MEAMLVDAPPPPPSGISAIRLMSSPPPLGGFKVVAFQAHNHVEDGDEHYYIAVAFTWVVRTDTNHELRLPWK